jgi:hypothetical protein
MRINVRNRARVQLVPLPRRRNSLRERDHKRSGLQSMLCAAPRCYGGNAGWMNAHRELQSALSIGRRATLQEHDDAEHRLDVRSEGCGCGWVKMMA